MALECRRMLSSAMPAAASDADCQVGAGILEVQEVGVVSLTHDQLEHELRTLHQERDHLMAQLRECSKSFREQIDKGICMSICVVLTKKILQGL